MPKRLDSHLACLLYLAFDLTDRRGMRIDSRVQPREGEAQLRSNTIRLGVLRRQLRYLPCEARSHFVEVGAQRIHFVVGRRTCNSSSKHTQWAQQ